MSVGYITTDGSDRYHTGEDCPLFKSGRLGNEALGISAKPIQHLTVAAAAAARQTPCQCVTQAEIDG